MSVLEHRLVIFYPALGDRNEIDQFKKCVIKHEHIDDAYYDEYYNSLGENDEYFEYFPSHRCSDISTVLVDFAGLFDTDITFWGMVRDEYEDHISWYNVMFNKKHCAVIGDRISVGKSEYLKRYSLVEGKNFVVHALEKHRNTDVNPVMLILNEHAYCENSVAQEEYEHDKYLYIKENDKSKSSDDEGQCLFDME